MKEQTVRAKTQEEVLSTLAELGGKLTADEDIKFKGNEFVIPENMKDLGEAAKFLYEKFSDEGRSMSFSKTFDYRPWDGALATQRAIKATFGMVRQVSDDEHTAQMITIPSGVGETEEVPWGTLVIPGFDGVEFELGGTMHREKGMLFKIDATGPKKFRHQIEGLFKLIQHELNTNSLYRGKAFDGQQMPEFIDLSGVDESKVIYSDDVMRQLNANVWALINHKDKLKGLGVPLKRAVLFEGPYGTGKTLGAYLTAQKAIENGWTFIYCRPGRDDMTECMNTAKLYQPSVVFMEDVDVVADSDGESSHVARLLDIFDGIQAKGTELLVVLTTNHVEKIHKGMVRPGRLDAIISIGALDRNGIERMAKSVLPSELLTDQINWDAVGEAMVGFLPAFVKEALDRTIRYSLVRSGEVVALTTDDFVDAANGLRPQLDIMDGASDEKGSNQLDSALSEVMRQAVDAIEIQHNAAGVVGHLVAFPTE